MSVLYTNSTATIVGPDIKNQYRPVVGILADGSYIVAWTAAQQGSTTGFQVYLQHMAANGVPLGAVQVVNDQGPSIREQTVPEIAILDDGFVIAWMHQTGDGRVSFRLYDDDVGVASAQIDGVIAWPEVAVAGIAGGGFVIGNTFQSAMRVKVFDADGQALTDALVVGSDTVSGADMVRLANGSAVITWRQQHRDNPYGGIYANIVSAAGVPSPQTIYIAQQGELQNLNPTVAALTGGGFVVVWAQYQDATDDYDILGRLYDSAGVPAGAAFELNEFKVGVQRFPIVQGTADGGFVVGWGSYNPDDVATEAMVMRRFSAVGAPLSEEQLIRPILPHLGSTFDLDLAARSDGGFVAVWQQWDNAVAGFDVYTQVFQASADGQLTDGDDRGFGTDAAEHIRGGLGDDVLLGDGGDDRLDGGGGSDDLTGGAGADVFVVSPGGGSDRILDFEDGVDRLDITPFGRYLSLVQAGADAVLTFAGGVTVTLVGVSAASLTPEDMLGYSPFNLIRGTDKNNVLNGTADRDRIEGLAGNDVLRGAGGDDRLEGGAGVDRLLGDAGDDVLLGGAGDDTLTGGAGADEFVVEAAGEIETVRDFKPGQDRLNMTAVGQWAAIGQQGEDVVISLVGGGAVVLIGVELASLTNGDFIGAMLVPPPPPPSYTVVNGTPANNILTGSTGADQLLGFAGNDVLKGGDGGDWLLGGVGLDRLYGDKGDDILDGEAGNDSLTGGAGADRFVKDDDGSTDTILDFSLSQNDRIDLSDFGGYLSIQQAGADTLVSLAGGSALLLKAFDASKLLDSHFIGLSSGLPDEPTKWGDWVV